MTQLQQVQAMASSRKKASMVALLGLRPACLLPAALLLLMLLLLPSSAWLLRAAVQESSWRWAQSSGGAWPAGGDAVEARLRDLEARLDHLSGSGGAGGGWSYSSDTGGSGGYSGSDITRALALHPAGSPRHAHLHRQLYCHNYTVPAAAAAAGTTARPLVWAPEPGKFLFPLCDYGQVSNRVNCLRWYMLLAALLRRALVVPDAEAELRGYNYTLVVDVPHARRCLGDAANATVVTLREYARARAAAGDPRPVAVDSVWCWRTNCPLPTYRRMFPDVAMPGALAAVNVSGRVASAADVVRELGGVTDAVISLGNLFRLEDIAGLPPRTHTSANLPLVAAAGAVPSACRLVIQPHPAIVLAAKGYARTVLGRPYAALHLRRGDFHHFWGPDCRRDGSESGARGCRIPPLTAVAACVADKLAHAPGAPQVLYVASNAHPAEAALLESLLRAAGITVVRAPRKLAGDAAGPGFFWAQEWSRNGLDQSPLARATFDKLVCAMADLFMGSLFSTFTDDIVGMRAGLGTLTCRDQDVCALYDQGSGRGQGQPHEQGEQEESGFLPHFNVTFSDGYQGTRTYRRRLSRRRLL